MQTSNCKRILAIFALFSATSICSIALGDNWTNGSGGSWGVGTNWSNNVVPTSATFNLGSSGYTVTLPGPESVISLVVQTDNPTITLNSNTLSVQTQNIPFGLLQIAPTSGQIGSLTVNGPGSIGGGPLNISVATAGTGQLTVNDATMTCQGTGSNFSEGSGGGITVENGGSIQDTNQVNVVNLAGSLTLNDGSLSVQAGLSMGGVMMSNGSGLGTAFGNASFTGAVTADDSSIDAGTGSIIFNGGSLTVSDGGVMTAGTNLTLPSTTNVISGKLSAADLTTFSGTTMIQLSSTTNNPFFGNMAAYGGILDFTLQNGFTPTIGEQFDVFHYLGTITGTFSAVNLPALSGGEAWDTSKLYTTGVIAVVPEPASVGMLAVAGLTVLRRRRRNSH